MRYRRDDDPDPVPPEEAGIPRWRRPSVQAARFAQSAPRRTVLERYQAEVPTGPFDPLTVPDRVPPPPSKEERLAARTGIPNKGRPAGPSRRLSSPESA